MMIVYVVEWRYLFSKVRLVPILFIFVLWLGIFEDLKKWIVATGNKMTSRASLKLFLCNVLFSDHMPSMHLQHGRRYRLGHFSGQWEQKWPQHCSSQSLPPACLRSWLKFNFAGMPPAVELCDGSSWRRQAVPAARSHIHRWHMRTRLNLIPAF